MSDWATSTLENMVDVLDNRRVPLNEEQRATMPGSIPYYGANGVQGYINKAIYSEPLILMAEDGGNFDEFAQRPIAYRIDGPSWVNNHAHVLKAKPGFNQDFIFYNLEHKDIRQFIKGGTRAKLNAGDLKDILITYPTDENEQRGIAEVLSALDEQIEQTEALVEKSVLRRVGLVQECLLPLAHQAPTVALGDACSIITSGSRGWAQYYSDDGALFLRIGNLTRAHPNFRLEDVIRVRVPEGGEGARTRLAAGDVLISITADLGVIGCVPEGMEAAYVNQHIALARISGDELNPRWVAHVLGSPFGFDQIAKLNDGGAKAGLNLPTIRALRIPRPSPEMQATIVQLLDSVDDEIALARAEAAKLRLQKQGLMRDLLTGKVRVAGGANA